MNNENRVKGYVARHKDGTWVEEIAKDLNLHRFTVKKTISKMEGAGTVKIVHKGNIKMIYPIKEVKQ